MCKKNSFDRFGDDLCSLISSCFDIKTQLKFLIISKQWNRCMFLMMPHLDISILPHNWDDTHYIFRVPKLFKPFIQTFRNIRQLTINGHHKPYIRRTLINGMNNLKIIHFNGLFFETLTIDNDLDKLPPSVHSVFFSCILVLQLISPEMTQGKNFITTYGQKTKSMALTFNPFNKSLERKNQFKEFIGMVHHFPKLEKLKIVYVKNFGETINLINSCLSLRKLVMENIEKIEINQKMLNALEKLKYYSFTESLVDFVFISLIEYELNSVKKYYCRIKNNDFNDLWDRRIHGSYISYDKAVKTAILSIDGRNDFLLNKDVVYLVVNINKIVNYSENNGKQLECLIRKNQNVRHLRTQEEWITDELFELFIERANNNPQLDYSLSAFNSKRYFMAVTENCNLYINLQTKLLFCNTIF